MKKIYVTAFIFENEIRYFQIYFHTYAPNMSATNTNTSNTTIPSFPEMRKFFKGLSTYQREELEALCESGSVPSFTKDVCEAVVTALSERSAATAQHFKPATRRKRKNPNDPKGPKNAYIFFTMDDAVRKEISDANPGISRTEMTKLIGQKWGSLSDAEKQRYQDLSDNDKARYEREMSERSSASDDSVVAAASGTAAAVETTTEEETSEPPAKKQRKKRAPKAEKASK
jgi:hypothetical protein